MLLPLVWMRTLNSIILKHASIRYNTSQRNWMNMVSLTNVLPEEQKDQEVILSVRPEEFLLNKDSSTEGITATVDDCVFLGLNTHYFVHLESGEEVEIIQESSIDSIIQPGTQIKLTLNTSKVNVFNADGSKNILTGVCNDCPN